jgi:hypothetical protein
MRVAGVLTAAPLPLSLRAALESRNGRHDSGNEIAINTQEKEL